jgi:diguanylate cyclase (GGDEF)-like protein
MAPLQAMKHIGMGSMMGSQARANSESTLKPMSKTVHPLAVQPTTLHTLRLHLLKLLLLCGSCAITFLWFVEAGAARLSPIDRFSYPFMIAIFLVCCSMLFLRPSVLEHIERLSFATFAIYIVVHGQPVLLASMASYEFASLTQWFPLVYTAAFFFLNTRQAILVSVLVYLSIMLPYGIGLIIGDSALWTSDRGLLMMNIVCAHPVYIVILSGIATLKTHVMQAGVYAGVLREVANIDYLTGVANRRAASHLLQGALERAHAGGAVMSVILLDIDHFKLINDTFGHDVGDKVLIQMPTILQEHLRASDMLGRWGGEEFVIVTNETDTAEATHMAERLRAQVASYEFAQVGQRTASFGVATSISGDTPESLMKRADQALYLAKQGGRNRVEVAFAHARSHHDAGHHV